MTEEEYNARLIANFKDTERQIAKIPELQNCSNTKQFDDDKSDIFINKINNGVGLDT
jgi:hypothetical protein